jgi:hypothetical protein
MSFLSTSAIKIDCAEPAAKITQSFHLYFGLDLLEPRVSFSPSLFLTFHMPQRFFPELLLTVMLDLLQFDCGSSYLVFAIDSASLNGLLDILDLALKLRCA